MLRTWRAKSARGGMTAIAAVAAVTAVPLTAILLTLGGNPSAAAATSVGLGTAESFAVLGGQAVTNTGPTVAWGDLGVSPQPDVSGFPPGTVLGAIHRADAVAQQAQSDLTTAYGVLAGQPSDQAITDDLAGRRLTTGVYTASSSMGLSGELTLDAQGDPSAVFIFQVGSTLITAPGSTVTLANGAQACNVFWQVGSSATLDTNSTLRGTVVALTSITANSGAMIEGRLLARNGAVTLDDNVITQPGCATGPTDTGTGSGGPTTDVGSGGPTTDVGSGSPNPDDDGTGPGGADSGGPSTEDTGTDDSSLRPPDERRPPDQVTPPPTGFPNTGDGGSVMDRRSLLLSGGSLALALAAGLLLWWRRATPTE